MIKILTIRDFELVDEIPEFLAMSMNIGDIFLPKGTGWEYKVVKKVYFMDNETKQYTFQVNVKKL